MKRANGGNGPGGSCCSFSEQEKSVALGNFLSQLPECMLR